jgi:hypothetical protein
MRIPTEAINAAAYVFEGANGNTLGEWQISEIDQYGLRNVDVTALATELVRIVEAETPDSKGHAYWALGKKVDASLLPFFRKQLGLELGRDIEAVYQIMIALDNLDEPVFADGGTSHSSSDYERNRDCAQRYLAALPEPS